MLERYRYRAMMYGMRVIFPPDNRYTKRRMVPWWKFWIAGKWAVSQNWDYSHPEYAAVVLRHSGVLAMPTPFRYATYWRCRFDSSIEVEASFSDSSSPEGADSVADAVAAVRAWNRRINHTHYFLKPPPEELP